MPPILTLAEYATVLRTDRATLEAATEAYSAAQATYERLSGAQYYANAEQAATAAARYLPDLERAEQTAATTATAVKASARAIMDATSTSAVQISPAEEANAAARSVLYREDCETLPFPALLAAITTAVHSSDRPAMWLYFRYGRARLRAQDATPLDSGDERAKSAVGDAISAIAALLDNPSTRATATAARELLSQADALEAATEARKRAANPPQYAWSNPATDVRW